MQWLDDLWDWGGSLFDNFWSSSEETPTTLGGDIGGSSSGSGLGNLDVLGNLGGGDKKKKDDKDDDFSFGSLLTAAIPGAIQLFGNESPDPDKAHQNALELQNDEQAAALELLKLRLAAEAASGGSGEALAREKLAFEKERQRQKFIQDAMALAAQRQLEGRNQEGNALRFLANVPINAGIGRGRGNG